MANTNPIVLTADQSTSLTLLVSGNPLSLTCKSYPNNSLPTGVSTTPPAGNPISPIIAVANDTTDTPTGPYELYCPGTPIGNIVLNDVQTVGNIAPASPQPGQQFNLTGYQTKVTIPKNLVTAASAFGSMLQGSATAAVDVQTGATPPQISSGTLNFNVPIPNPPTALELDLPTPAATIGPFTASTTTPPTVTSNPTTCTTLPCSLTLAGSGFGHSEMVSAVLDSGTTSIGSATTDATGSFTGMADPPRTPTAASRASM